MKTFIVGMRGIGVTTFIKEKMIHNELKYKIFDFTGEYKDLQFEKYRLNLGGMSPIQIRSYIHSACDNTPADVIFIFDSWNKALNPQMTSKGTFAFAWLNTMLRDRKCILTAQSLKDISDSFTGVVKIHKFRTLDKDAELVTKYQKCIQLEDNGR